LTFHPQASAQNDFNGLTSQPNARQLGTGISPMKPNSTFDQSMQWLSRTVAVVIMMVSPGLLGMWLDGRMNTRLFTPVGFLFGIVLATTLLLILAQKFAPPARGKPLPFEDEQPELDEQPAPTAQEPPGPKPQDTQTTAPSNTNRP
jgi:hypothetical protein